MINHEAVLQVAAAYDDFNRREWDTADHSAEAALLAGVKLQRVMLSEGIATLRQAPAIPWPGGARRGTGDRLGADLGAFAAHGFGDVTGM